MVTGAALPSLYSEPDWLPGWDPENHAVLLAEERGRVLCAEVWRDVRDGLWRWRVGELTLLGFDRWARCADPSATDRRAKQQALRCLKVEANCRG